jgi:arylsulfatase A-like enzyme
MKHQQPPDERLSRSFRPGHSAAVRVGALLTLALLLLVRLPGCSTEPRSQVRPGSLHKRNVVVFVSDALRACSLPIYGYPIDTTPRLDAFARRATVFARHMAHYPATPGSVSQMMTGRLMSPWLLEVRPAVTEARRPPEDMRTLPARLRDAGFRTGLVTTHYLFFRGAPLLRDFDYSVVVGPPPGHAWAAAPALTPGVQEFLTSVARQRTPFFLYVHAMDTHSPYEGWHLAPPRDLPKARRYAAYDARIEDVDQWFGSLLDLLGRLRLDETTVVVFTSDHGEDHGEMGPNLWDRFHGFTLRESILHVPLIIRVPEDPHPGRVYEGTTAHFDLAPTLFALATGNDAPSGFPADGMNLSRFWKDGSHLTAQDRAIPAFNPRYWGFFSGERLVRFDAWGGQLSEFTFARDQLNYPRPVEVKLSQPSLGKRLVEERRRDLAQYLAFPPTESLRDQEAIGVPTWVETSKTEAPTYEADPTDDRWTVNAWMILRCFPEETCPPLEVATPWVPGRYRLSVQLAEDGEYASYRNRFRLQVLSPGGPSTVMIRPRGRHLVDAGVHQIGDMLRLRVSSSEGGVAVHGLVIEREQAAPSRPRDSREREEQLRALGYLE